MAPGQNNAAVIHFSGRAGGLIASLLDCALQQGSATGWTPVRVGILRNGVAMAANALHI
jgi:hypothetical protein